MHGAKIQIWFFIGTLLLVYGLMILGYGIFEVVCGCYPSNVQLTSLHTPIWWGGLLTTLGLIYCIKFRPGRT